jgi:hypothetical protein
VQTGSALGAAAWRDRGGGFRLELASSGGRSLSSPVVVIATGTRFRARGLARPGWRMRAVLAAAGRVHLGPAAVASRTPTRAPRSR